MDTAWLLGLGIYFRGQWCAGIWPKERQTSSLTRDLTFLEFFPILGALWLWSNECANSVFRFWCDNLTVVHIINTLSSRSKKVMRLVRTFVLRILQFNIIVHTQHIPSIADTLSHQQTLALGACRWPEVWLPGRGKPASNRVGIHSKYSLQLFGSLQACRVFRVNESLEMAWLILV